MARFKANTRGLKMVGGNLVLCHEVVMKKEFSEIYDAGTGLIDRANYIKNGSEEYEAVCFLMGANHEYDNLKKDLAHSVNVGRDEYPKTIQGAYELLTHTASENQRRDRRYTGRGRGHSGRGFRNVQVSFAQGRGRGQNRQDQASEPIAGTNGTLVAHIRCYRCNRFGHYSDHCPNAQENENNSNGVNAAQAGENGANAEEVGEN